MLIKLGFVLLLAHACTCDDSDDYRLNMDITVESYTLNLVVPQNFETVEEPVTGNVEIKFKPTVDGVNLIRIHHGSRVEFADTDVTLSTSQAPTQPPAISSIARTAFEIVNIALTDPLAKDTDYILNFKDFNTTLSTDDMHGFYLSSYEVDNEKKYLATTQFQPTHARQAFPCFDEPSYKAKFTITITVPAGYTAVSNTQGTETTAGVYTFKETPKMSTYLVAFIVSSFESVPVEGAATDNRMTIFVPEGRTDSANFASQESRKIINKLSELTKTDFWTTSTLKKLDQAAIPDFSAGAMENWGLVTYRETALLYDENYSTLRNKQRIAQVIAHEFTHMWFGNLRTTKWWDTTWLNEGFARYFEYFAPAELYGNWELDKQFVIEQVQSIMTSDGIESANPLTSDANTPTEISSKFDSITYNKGASVIRMMRELVSATNFDDAIEIYLNEEFSSTTPDELFAAIQQKAPVGINVKDIMEKWTTQSGYPVIKVALSDKNVSFEQEQFLYHGTSNKTWQVPLRYRKSKDGAVEAVILDEKLDVSLELGADDYILVNPDQIGYYRVLYDSNLLARLVKVLSDDTKRSEISSVSRAQFVDDIMNLARAGKITYSVAFGSLDWLAKETDYYPWYSAFNSFNFLRRRLQEGTLKTQITKRLENLMSALYKSTQPETPTTTPATTTKATIYADDSEHVVDTYKQILSYQWACEINNKDCTDKAMQLMNDQRDEAKNYEIPNDFRSVAYCSAVRHDSTNATWEYLWDRFQNTSINSANEKVTILTALGCSKDTTLLDHYLAQSINGNIRSQDANSAFTAVLTGNPEGVARCLNFLDGSFDEIAKSYGGLNALNNVIRSISDRITDSSQLTTLKGILETHKGKLEEDVIKAATDLAEANLAWAESAQKELSAYFTTTGAASRATITWTLLLVVLAVFFRP